MELRNKTQSKSIYSIRQKLKRVISVALSVLMVTSVIDYTGLVSVNAQTQSDAKIVTAFAELPEDIYNQQISQGSSETDVSLPNTLNVTVKSIIEENADTDGENAENITQGVPELIVDETAVESTEESTDTNSEINMEESQNTVNSEESSAETADDSTLEKEIADSESDQKETMETVVVESVENYAEPPAQNVETVVKNMTEEGTDQIATSTVREVLEDITIENISWKLNASASSTGSFDSAIAGAVYFYEPVLPEDYVLAEGISLPQIRVEIVEKEDNVQSFEKSQTIDGIVITVSAEAGVFPEEAMLTVKKIVDSNEQEKIEEAVKQEVKAEETTKTVEELISFDITITDVDGIELQPDTSKGEVTVSFAQLPMLSDVASPVQELKVFHMDESFNEATGLDTTVNQETESVEATAEHFSVYTVAELTTEISANVEAEIKAADGTLTYYDTIEEAITAAIGLEGCTVKLLKDVGVDSYMTIDQGIFTLDLNGYIWEFTSYGAFTMHGNGVIVIIKDSRSGGGIRTAYDPYALKVMGANVRLEGGTYSAISSDFDVIGNLLADGCAYKKDDGTWVTDMSVNSISSVTVVEAPNEILAASVTDVNTNITRKYLTIDKAIAAATGLSGSIVTLLNNVSANDSVHIGSGKFTIDLNGKTW
ncbi:MAG: hypothetical protein PHT21_11840, partial [Lachnospiraceae bacterium]|nr:hypothetical protein [Lachnospiraceae bacterium]